jgi:hypothetical protein
MDTVENSQGRDLFQDVKERVGKEKGGIWVGRDCPVEVLSTSGGIISANLNVTDLFVDFGLEEKESIELSSYLIKRNSYSIRSRLQQSAFGIKRFDLGVDGRLNLAIENLTRKEVTNIPQSFDLLRFFIEDPSKRLKGDDFFVTMERIYGNANPQVPENLMGRGENLKGMLTWHAESIAVIRAPEINLKQILESKNRKELHKVLGLEWGPIDSLQPKGFYVVDTDQNLEVPRDVFVRIVTDPDNYYELPGNSMPHLASPIIDPGFKGSVMLEFMRTYTEQDDSANNVGIVAYKQG